MPVRNATRRGSVCRYRHVVISEKATIFRNTVTEFDQVKVHFTILQNIELVNIFRIFVDFLFDKPSYESRSTNGDDLKPSTVKISWSSSDSKSGRKGLLSTGQRPMKKMMFMGSGLSGFVRFPAGLFQVSP